MPTVVELRAELKAKGLSTTGKKAELVARLTNSSMIDLTNTSTKRRARKTGPKSFHLHPEDYGYSSPRKKRKGESKTSTSSSSSSSQSSSPSNAGSELSSEEINDMKDLANLSRKAIESRFQISGKKGKEGTTFVAIGNSGKEYAIKLFKATKSSAKLSNEAEYQKLAAEHGISPRVFAVNVIHKYIIMEKLEETIVDYMRRKYPETGSTKPLTNEQQLRIIEICEKLDNAKVVQNDGNPLNLMLNKNGKIMVIDFGYAKAIDKKVLQKRGPEPNINLTLWHMHRQLRFYKIMGPLLEERVSSYMKTLKK